MQYYSNSTVLSYYNTSMAIVHGQGQIIIIQQEIAIV